LEIFADYHTHTRHSHGRGTVEDNIRAAAGKGLDAVAISDHGPAGIGIGIKRADTLLQIKKEVALGQAKYPAVKALTGVEANVVSLDGRLDVPEAILRQLDVVMAGLHLQIVAASLADEAGLVLNNLLARLSRRTAEKVRVANTKAIVEAVSRNRVDIVTHPGLQLSIDTKELAVACAKNGTALEINSAHGNMTKEFIQIGLRAGAKFAVGSDAHQPHRVGDFARALALIEAAGLPAVRIINARESDGTTNSNTYGGEAGGKD